MNILAITCWTGGREMAEMTYRMLSGLREALPEASSSFRIHAHGQGTEERLPDDPGGKIRCTYSPKNVGFAFGMNAALGHQLIHYTPDAVLCINNDIEFPDADWLKNLVRHGYLEEHVSVPLTTYTSCDAQRAEIARDEDSFSVSSTPAVCWLIPWSACQVLFKYSGGFGKLFLEDIGRAWGEDGFAAAVLQKHFNPKPFKIVPRSFVKHLGCRTSSKVSAAEKMACYHKSLELIREIPD